MSIRNQIRAGLRRVVSFAQAGPPFMSHPERIDGLAHTYSLHPTARLTVVEAERFTNSRIGLGRGVYIGRHVELTAAQGGNVTLGDDTSLQDECVISGNVRVGAHCLFGRYIFVGSTHHRFADKPAWLIRDQDVYFPSHPAEANGAISAAIRIEDDCWIGQGVVIQPGVYVGRGAVIGANAVVTSDIGPYEIHGGVPNRKIGSRLAFSPPLRLEAADETAIPYFYRGFRLTQAELSRSRVQGLVEGAGQTCLVLASGGGTLRLCGQRLDPSDLRLRLRINGVDRGAHDVTSDAFELRVDIPIECGDGVPPVLSGHTFIEIEVADHAGRPSQFGVCSATIAEK